MLCCVGSRPIPAQDICFGLVWFGLVWQIKHLKQNTQHAWINLDQKRDKRCTIVKNLAACSVGWWLMAGAGLF
jgi:hypothetical protein